MGKICKDKEGHIIWIFILPTVSITNSDYRNTYSAYTGTKKLHTMTLTRTAHQIENVSPSLKPVREAPRGRVVGRAGH